MTDKTKLTQKLNNLKGQLYKLEGARSPSRIRFPVTTATLALTALLTLAAMILGVTESYVWVTLASSSLLQLTLSFLVYDEGVPRIRLMLVERRMIRAERALLGESTQGGVTPSPERT